MGAFCPHVTEATDKLSKADTANALLLIDIPSGTRKERAQWPGSLDESAARLVAIGSAWHLLVSPSPIHSTWVALPRHIKVCD
jgi:hypothetical protein